MAWRLKQRDRDRRIIDSVSKSGDGLEISELCRDGLDFGKGIRSGKLCLRGGHLLKEVFLRPGEIGVRGAGFGADEGEEVGG